MAHIINAESNVPNTPIDNLVYTRKEHTVSIMYRNNPPKLPIISVRFIYNYPFYTNNNHSLPWLGK